MHKHIYTGLGGLVLGLVIGFFVSNNLNRAGVSPTTPSLNPADAPFLNQQVQNASVKESTGAMMSDVSQTLEQAKNEPENFEAQLKAGSMYAQIQNVEKAVVYYDNAAALKPTEYEKIVRLGNAFFDIGRYESAAAFYEQAIEKNPKDINVRTDLGITFVERPNPDYDRGIKEFSSSLALNPKHEPTLYNLAFAHFKKGDQTNARKYLAQLESANPNSQLIAKLKQAMGNN
jgi:tetratricopeptide (TPR) repeat protein